MRKFSITLELPSSCGCCGSPLPPSDNEVSPGLYKMELPEGDVPTQVCIGHGVRITLARGRLLVELRQDPNSRGTWDLERHFNPQAFRLLKAATGEGRDEATGGWLWHVFTFDLPAFEPGFSTWWAELKFLEMHPYKRFTTGTRMPSAHPSKLSVKLETLE